MPTWVPEEKWEYIVKHMPIPSVDLLVQTQSGVLLGKRTNEPAKGRWFVPGGRIQKGEKRTEAVHRIANEELNVDVSILEYIGTFEHVYGNSEIGEDIVKHYLASAYVVRPNSENIRPNNQHSSFKLFKSFPKSLHEHIKCYLKEANMVGTESGYQCDESATSNSGIP